MNNMLSTTDSPYRRGAHRRSTSHGPEDRQSWKECSSTGTKNPEYVRVRIGLIGRRSVLIPAQFAEIDDERRILVLK